VLQAAWLVGLFHRRQSSSNVERSSQETKAFLLGRCFVISCEHTESGGCTLVASSQASGTPWVMGSSKLITIIHDVWNLSNIIIHSFWSYELLKRSLSSPEESRHQEAMKVIVCGGVAGIITWASVFPLDVVKTRLQAQPLVADREAQRRPLLSASPSRPRLLSSLDITRDAYHSEGLSVFFRGLGVCSIRAFVVNAAQVSRQLHF
jgi:hypothetical protein